MWKIILLLCALVLIETEALTLRNSFVDNITSGLKMLGINDRRLFTSHRNYYNRLPSGISDNVADLVSQSFAPTKSNENKRNKDRQDSVVIGDVPSSTTTDNSLMGGMLQLLGFDSSKVGAVAVNGIIFIAQMVRFSATRLLDYVISRTADLYRIVDYIGERMNNETSTAAPTSSLVRF